MRIAQFTTEMRAAGAERVVSDLSRGLQARGHTVTVVSLMPLPPESPILDELSEARIPVLSVGLTASQPWRVTGYPKVLRGLNPDIVHAHLFHPCLLSRLRRPPGSRVINTVHLADRRPDRFWQFVLDRWTRSRCDIHTAVSNAVRAFHAPRIGLNPSVMRVIPNGVSPAPLLTPDERRALRTEWGMESCARVLGSTGRLAHQKGYDLLLAMLPELGAQIPAGETWGLVLVGEGPMRPSLEQAARRAPSNLRVHFTGFRADAARCPGAMDLFLMPSRFEGFGIGLIEAMAQGVPALSSRADSLPELIAQYPNGRCVDFTPEHHAAIAAQIVQLSSLPHRPLTPFPFSREAMIDAYEGLYREALS